MAGKFPAISVYVVNTHKAEKPINTSVMHVLIGLYSATPC